MYKITVLWQNMITVGVSLTKCKLVAAYMKSTS